jgi:ligand-binding sensor domain-containing protein
VSRGILNTAVGLASLGAALVFTASAAAAPAVDGEFAFQNINGVPATAEVGSNNEIVEGPDGNMWFTTEVVNGVIRMTPAGQPTFFPIANSAFGITVGPDDNLWVATAIGVIRIPPANPAGATAFNVGIANGRGITTGPDGKIWVVGDDKLVSFSPANPEGTDDSTTVNPGGTAMSARGMDTGSDGLLWIADGGGRVISATAAATPVITAYEAKIGGTGGVQDVAAGPDGQIAYANPLSTPQSVGRITPGGTPQVTELVASDPFGVVFGQDEAYWIARAQNNDLLRLTPDGQTTPLTGFAPSGGVGPRKIATGPDGTLWVTLDTPEKVARVTGVEPPAPPPGGGTETTLDKKPKKKLKTSKRKAKAKFKFSSSDPAATFECKLKKPKRQGGKRALRAATFKPCNSPKTYKLKPGKYTFSVRAVVGGVADPTPPKHKFKVVAL